MVESTALEMRHTGNRIEGSNPSLSAILLRALRFAGLAARLVRSRMPFEALAKKGRRRCTTYICLRA